MSLGQPWLRQPRPSPLPRSSSRGVSRGPCRRWVGTDELGALRHRQLPTSGLQALDCATPLGHTRDTHRDRQPPSRLSGDRCRRWNRIQVPSSTSAQRLPQGAGRHRSGGSGSNGPCHRRVQRSARMVVAFVLAHAWWPHSQLERLVRLSGTAWLPRGRHWPPSARHRLDGCRVTAADLFAAMVAAPAAITAPADSCPAPAVACGQPSEDRLHAGDEDCPEPREVATKCCGTHRRQTQGSRAGDRTQVPADEA